MRGDQVMSGRSTRWLILAVLALLGGCFAFTPEPEKADSPGGEARAAYDDVVDYVGCDVDLACTAGCAEDLDCRGGSADAGAGAPGSDAGSLDLGVGPELDGAVRTADGGSPPGPGLFEEGAPQELAPRAQRWSSVPSRASAVVIEATVTAGDLILAVYDADDRLVARSTDRPAVRLGEDLAARELRLRLLAGPAGARFTLALTPF